MTFSGIWHIYEMENWDEDYFNMDVQAYIEINERGTGDFQFGLVTGQIDGEIVKDKSGEKLEFTWEGGDENDEASGSGWVRLKDVNTLEGKIKFHEGDSSLFSAKRVQNYREQAGMPNQTRENAQKLPLAESASVTAPHGLRPTGGGRLGRREGTSGRKS